MNDSIYVGSRASNLEHSIAPTQITRVKLKKDDETTYDVSLYPDDGATLQVECPWATSTMASNILDAVSGFSFVPFNATSASVDLAAEPGDGVTVGGIYSVLGEIDTNDDGNSDISARASGELESEYPYLTSNEKLVAQAKAAAEAKAQAAQDTADDAYAYAEAAYEEAEEAQTTIGRWTYSGSTKIDGTQIMTGTVTASVLQGGTINILGSNGNVYGEMYAGTNTAGTTAFELAGSYGLRFTTSGNIYLYDGSGFILLSGHDCSISGDTHPSNDNSYSCGTSARRWTDVYATNGTIQTSDRQVKEDINYDLSDYAEFSKKIKPVSYKFSDGHRTHLGFIAQDVEQALSDCDISTENFAGFIKSEQEDGTYNYALRYTEFIALQQYQIQKLEERIKALEDQLNGG